MNDEKETTVYPEITKDSMEAADESHKQKKYDEAFNQYMIYAEKGDKVAQMRIGMMYMQGEGVVKSMVRAFDWIMKSAEQEYARAEYLIGQMYFNGWYVSKNYHEALKWFKRTVDHGYKAACHDIGYIYLTGHNNSIFSKLLKSPLTFNVDYKEAFKYFKESVDNPVSMYYLGSMYESGKGVKKNYEEAIYWYTMSAQAECTTAINSLGYMYLNGVHVKQNIDEAIKWYTKLGDKNYRDAQYILGNIYRHTKRDIIKSYTWFWKAAVLGHERALDGIYFSLRYLTHAERCAIGNLFLDYERLKLLEASKDASSSLREASIACK